VEITQLYQLYLQYPSIQTDTRKIKQGDLFFALKGPNFNGNQFAKEALTKGAAYAIVDEPIEGSNERIILTNNALSTLQNLAKHHRQQFNIPFIAITGSNGKTTTKELVSTVLASHFTTYTTQGNLNNHIGVPLTILSIPLNAQMAVIEMGANHQKEIESYCTYTLPTHGIITNCGKAHLEGFGGEEGIKKGKGELYDYLKKNNGTAFVYWDYDYLQTMSTGIPNIIKYGTIDGIVTGKVHSNNPFLAVSINKETPLSTIYTQLVGDYNLPNILCAVTIGKYFKVPDEKIKTAIENYIPSNSRSQLLEKGNNKIILDAYNANPTSMKAAIENFAAIVTDKKKIIFIGAMMEMGEQSIQEHEQIIALLQQFKWEQVILVGGDFKRVQHPFLYMNNSIEAKAYYSEQKFENSFCLIKGSRSIQMEKILD
jgi:UDP-N-acetylmuramoyl-tripeptide--D-alanyl-D-alanine ligase